jgi:hypothetical protein
MLYGMSAAMEVHHFVIVKLTWKATAIAKQTNVLARLQKTKKLERE